jgi:uncharacterized protein involved in outer membrane biogenesis
MKLKRLVFIGILIFVVLGVVPFLIPAQAYLPKIEQAATASLGVPVRIESLHWALLPTPRVLVGGISIGDQEEIHVDRVAAVLDLHTLLTPVRAISYLEVHHPVVKKTVLSLLSTLGASATHRATPPPVEIRHVDIHDAELQWAHLPLPRFDIAGELQGNTVQSLHIVSEDRRIKADITPLQQGWSIKSTADQWVAPIGPPLRLDSLTVDAEFSGKQVRIKHYRVNLYSGWAAGEAQLDWEKYWRVSGKANVAHVEVAKPSALFSKRMHLSGSLSGNGEFHAAAPVPEMLADRLLADFKFSVDHGVLHGVDLAKAASLFIKQNGDGGETAFDELSGNLHLTGKQIQVQHLQVVSGLLAANGHVTVSPAKTLDGQVDVELKKGLALVTVPLQVSGTLDAPVVMPTRAAVAGATAGTAVLGPLGTALGMKAGSAWDRWFGGKK